MTPSPRMFPHFSKHTQRRTLEVTEVEDMLCGARDGDCGEDRTEGATPRTLPSLPGPECTPRSSEY